MMNFQKSEETRVLLWCHYCQVHSNLEVVEPVRVLFYGPKKLFVFDMTRNKNSTKNESMNLPQGINQLRRVDMLLNSIKI